MLHAIQEIKEIAPFTLTVRFNTGEVLKINLEERLRQWSASPTSTFRALLDQEYFATVKLNPEIETIYWDNGIDFCPDVLYAMGQQV